MLKGVGVQVPPIAPYLLFMKLKLPFHIHFHSNHASIIRTLIFTCGHYFIDASCTHFITGAEWHKAFAVGIVSPMLNAVWYYLLDRFFFGYLFLKCKKGSK